MVQELLETNIPLEDHQREAEELLPDLPTQLEEAGSNERGRGALYPINTREVGRTPSQLQWTGYSWYPF